ncbi:hypothetical protein [Microbacterium sp. MPKO10]|uniref:hypothetical protein n=1 Tax=Microbacterium sp. MPKO10 TaxID=2989818 RepID=UPI002236A290|nr:hypothetical protein [Microbacterium sp. MPKO10]MCW4458727.1 hypothetical protein [Microbacterium sp. MPKO10]
MRPSGVFLFVTHDINDLTTSVGFDPQRYCQPGDVAALLGPGWTISVDEKRLRDSGAQRATNHTHDAILCARREQNT